MLPMRAVLALLAVGRLASAAVLRREAVTPVQKVLELLGRLKAQVEEDGKSEAASYEKFSSFCAKEADEKAYVIGKSNKTIGVLEAKIEELEGDIAELDGQVADLQTDVSGEKNASALAVKARGAEYDDHVASRKNLTDGIAAIEGAMKSLRASKEQFDGAALLSTLRHPALRRVDGGERAVKGLLQKVAGKAAPGEPAGMEFKSKEVLALMQDLLRTFKAQLKKLDDEEGKAKHAHDMVEGARSNKVKFAEEDITEKETLSAQKTEAKAAKQKLADEETAARDADQRFLDDLTAQCEGKAVAWETRSKTRVDELAAINEAMQALSGVGSLYAANKKLVGLVAAAPSGGHAPRLRGGARAASFLQLAAASAERRRRDAGDGAGAVETLLAQAYGMYKERSLNTAEPTDHFVKVRSLIKDLISRLEQEALDEASAKSACDQQVKDAVTTRDKEVAETEKATSEISTAEATIKQLEAEVEDLSKDIANLHSTLNEMTRLRDVEKADNNKTVVEAAAGAEAVRQAITALKAFYGTAALEQQPAPAANAADRSGQTFGDKAPGTFEGEYTGRRAESKGVLGLLEVIASDFERTAGVTEKAEETAAQEFTDDKAAIDADLTAKEDAKETKESDTEAETEHRIELEDDLRDMTKRKEQAEATLESLKAACVDTGETWEERKAKREQEIEALKQALQLLEDWQS